MVDQEGGEKGGEVDDRVLERFFGEGIGLLPWSAQNYIIGFPGKIGMCMNAGVPVITSNYPGTSFVNKFGVGVVIDEMSPAAINAASIKIRNAGDAMRSRCLDLAKEFCFNVHVAPFVDFIRAETAVAKGS